MSGHMRKGFAIGMSAIALAAASPALASHDPVEPVKIGILDMRADRIADMDGNVRIHYREFLAEGETAGRRETPSGMDHGAVVATSAVRAVRALDRSAPIEIYSANAFRMSADGKGYTMRYEGAMQALDWMHSNGVRVVVTSYNTKNMAAAVSLMNRAQNLGMTVIAGASNVAGAGKVWPASDPRAISVADTTPSGSSLTLDATVQDWVKFGMRGDYADMNKGGVVEDWGSSYSSAKVGGLSAYYVSRNPEAGPAEIEAALKSVSRQQLQKHGQVKAVVAAIDVGDWSSRMRDSAQRGFQAPVMAMAMASPKAPSMAVPSTAPVMAMAMTGSKGPSMAALSPAIAMSMQTSGFRDR